MGSHGREWRTRTVARALMVMLAAAPALAQTSSRDSVSLAIRTLIATRTPILDVAETGDRLIVLGPDAMALYTRADALAGAPAIASVAVTHTRPWPRDVRGQLRLTGAGFQALLPGVVCRGTLRPFAASCADDVTPWGGLDSSGIAPSRNFFTTRQGLAFYSAVSLPAEGLARWLVADVNGTLSFLDMNGSVIPPGPADLGDDVARIADVCVPGTFAVAASQSAHAPLRDDLRLLSVAGTTLTTVASLNLPGAATALWPSAGSYGATVVVHDSGSSRYEAHQISVACAR